MADHKIIDKSKKVMITYLLSCGSSSVVEHHLAKVSEILILLFVRFFVIIFIVPKRTTHCSSIAQLVEQSAVNRFVVGSSPT